VEEVEEVNISAFLKKIKNKSELFCFPKKALIFTTEVM